jgi:hypothetical protein
MPGIFISYSRKDREYVLKLTDELENAGLPTWIDDRIDYGKQWPRVIQKQLDESDAVIVIMTHHSYQSDWVQNELSRAKRKRIPIYPLLLEGSEPWLAVESTQFIDVRGGKLPPDSFYRQLSQILQALRPITESQDEHWIQMLNEAYLGKVEILRIIDDEPRLIFLEAVELSDEQTSLAERKRKRFRQEGWPTDPYGIIAYEPAWNDDPLTIYYRTADQAEVETLREGGSRPNILSASVVVCCPESKELVLHRRADRSATYGGHLHTMGGSYIPKAVVRSDGSSLIRTAKREVLEESGLSITLSRPVPTILCKEIDTGFIQFVLLGATINLREKGALTASWEGGPVVVPFDQLPDRLLSTTEVWVPSGKVHVLSWLVLGAPGCDRVPHFGGYTPQELFRRTLI